MTAFSAAALLVVLVGVAQACQPPTLPPGGRWVPDQGCSRGNVYQTLSPPREKCSCWGRCGYICRPNNGNGGVGSPTTTTKSPSGSPCPFGGVYFNSKGERCRCQSFNQQPYYVCEPTTTTSTSTTTTTTTTTTETPADGGDSGN